MGKIRQISRRALKKEFLIRFGGTFLTVLALPSALLTIVGTHFSLLLTSCLIFCAFLLSAIVNRNYLIGIHLPVDDILPDDVETFRRMSLRCPCDLRITEQVGQLAQYWYKDESISPEKYEPLRVKNPFILASLTGAQGDFLGYFDVIPLKDSFAELFLQGRVTEKDITHEDIFTDDELALCRYVYISGLAVWNPDTAEGRRNAYILVWGMLKYLEHFYGATNPIALVSAVTKEGERLLQKFKLELVCEATKRVDKHSMYALALSQEEIAKRLACLLDYGLFCSLDWSPNDNSRLIPGKQYQKLPLPRTHLRSVSTVTSKVRRIG
jgi:hypothetical protein